MSWGSESKRRGDSKGYSHKSYSSTDRKYAQEFLFNPPKRNDHDDRMTKKYTPEREIFGDASFDDLAYKPKRAERPDWRNADSDGNNDVFEGDWTKELGINRKVLLVDPVSQKKSNGNCQEMALLEEFDHVHRVLSRTMHQAKQETCLSTPVKSKSFRNQAFVSQTSSDEEHLEESCTPFAPPPPKISLSIEEVERKIEKLDEEFKSIILIGAKSQVDLDLIEKKSEERRILKNTLKKIKRDLKHSFKNVKWDPVTPDEVFKSLKQQDSGKTSFVVQGKINDLDDALVYFGKYGALSKAEYIKGQDSMIKLEYFEKANALKALSAQHGKKFRFFVDPHPGSKRSTKETEQNAHKDDDFKEKVINSYFNQRARCSPADLRVGHFDENSCIQSQQVIDGKSYEERYPKIKSDAHMYSFVDVKPNKNNKFSLTITNHRHIFHTEEELYDYFVAYGDINNVSYTDGTQMEDRLDSKKDISIEFENGDSLLFAVNAKHNEISVDISEDCKVWQDFQDGNRNFSDNHSRKRRKSQDRSFHNGESSFPERTSPKQKKYDLHSDKENERHQFQNRSPRKPLDKKFASIPQGHSKHAKWECQQCGGINMAYEILHCYKCKTERPNNWKCEKCHEINTPEKLYCYKRRCQEIRKGNWVCPLETCKNVNWSRSLHCYQQGCNEVQPGAWNCQDCGNLNFRKNYNCFSCKHKTGMRARKRETHHESNNFVRNAELEKQRQAFEKVWQDENRNDSGRPRPEQEKLDKPRRDFHSEPSRDWASDFEKIREKNEKRIDEERKRARFVQNKLLALAGESQPGPSGFCAGRTGNTNFHKNVPDIVDLVDSEEELISTNRNTNADDFSMCKNANLVPIAPRRTKFNSEPEKDVFNEEVMEQLKSGNTRKQTEILKSFNIVQIESPKATSKSKIVEVDLLSDSEDAGMYSDGSSIQIEDDDMDVDQMNITNNENVGTAPRKDLMVHSEPGVPSSQGSSQDIIDKIVEKDLENSVFDKQNDAKDLPLDNDGDIVILSDE